MLKLRNMKDCIFCKIVNKELPSNVVLETEDVLVFREINPEAPVHVLVIPKKHIKNLNETKQEDKELLGELLLLVKEVAKKEDLFDKQYRVIINTGNNLVDHLHFHVVGGRDLGPNLSVKEA